MALTRTPPDERDCRSPSAIAPGDLLTFETAQALERQMLASVASGTGTASANSKIDVWPNFAVWQTNQALIVPSGMPRIAGFEEAARQSQDSGWPVFERDTGGDLTPQFSGILNVSMAFTLAHDERNIGVAYGRLIAPVIEFLREDLGVESYAASVEGAFCDGAHNIVVDERKLAGTAQRWRLMRGGAGAAGGVTCVLGHIALVCGGNLDTALDAVNRFYDACRLDRAVVPQAHVTLADLAPQADTSPTGLARRLSAFVARA
jgi:hypothetical protein